MVAPVHGSARSADGPGTANSVDDVDGVTSPNSANSANSANPANPANISNPAGDRRSAHPAGPDRVGYDCPGLTVRQVVFRAVPRTADTWIAPAW